MTKIRSGSKYLLLVLLGSMPFCEQSGEFYLKGETLQCPFECMLLAKERYTIGEPINLKFTLKNQTDRTQFILKWYTPLEGIFGEIFRVMRNGEEIPYRGILAKRGEPRREDYVSVEPGDVVSAEVDIAKSWDLSKAGKYRIEFISKLHDVTENESLIPRRKDAHRPQKLVCNAVQFEIIASRD